MALGGALGAVSRYVLGTMVSARLGTAWPWGTFVINVSGCFLIGFFLAYVAARSGISENWRYLFPVGFVGGYTTFSSYAWETVALVEQGAWLRATTYVLASTLLGIAAVGLAIVIARRV